MNFFPFFTDITDKTFLIIGGGAVAREKLNSISRFNEKIVIVARDTDIEEGENVHVIRKEFEDSDLSLGDFVIGATNDRTLNKRISGLCRKKGKPVNIVDDAELCTFFMPSIIKRGKLVTAISTNGASPAYAMKLRRELEKNVPDEIGDILDRMEKLRGSIPDIIDTQEKRKAFYKEALNALIDSDNSLSDAEIYGLAEKYK